jgi:hypothetical protein
MTLWNAWDDGEKHVGPAKGWEEEGDCPHVSDEGSDDGPFGPILTAVPAVTELPVPPPPKCKHCHDRHSSLLPELHPVTGSPVSRRSTREEMERRDDLMEGPEEILKGRGVWYYGEIPKGFGFNVFDAAEESVLQMVLMDTWPKFVKSRGGELAGGACI